MTPTVLDRRCQCGALLFWSAGVQACAECDEALSWTTNRRNVSRRNGLQFVAIVLASWVVPVVVAGLIIRGMR
jgi:hypothetical protein